MSHPTTPQDPQQPYGAPQSEQPYGPPQPQQPGYQQPYGAQAPGYPQQPGYQQGPHAQPASGAVPPQAYVGPGQPPAGATPPRAPKRAPWLLWLLLALGLILALVLGGFAYNALKPANSATTTAATTQAASTAPATTTPATTASTSRSASAAASSAASSASSGSASASRSSASGSASANQSAQAYAQQKYGTFETQTITGEGDKVIPLPAGVKAGLITAENTSNVLGFTLNTQTASGGMGELLFSTEHFSKGTRMFGVMISDPATSIKVTSTGAWKITLAPVASAPVQKPPCNGHGDTVFLYDGPGGNWTFNHNGTENFRVTQAGPGVVNPIVVNKIGRYSGQQQVHAGPLVIEMHGDGDWDIKA